MRYHLFEPSVDGNYQVALLMKVSAFKQDELRKNYVNKLAAHGLSPTNVIAYTLEYNELGKAPVKHIKEYLLESLLPALTSLKVTHLYCSDSAFFKVLTGQAKADVHAGYVLPCKIDGFQHLHVVLGMNYQQLIYDPSLQTKLDAGLFALASHLQGAYQAPGTGIIHQAVYPEGVSSIQAALNALHEYPTLACDIEAFSLRFNEAGIGTIAFAPDQHRFVAFPCDYQPNNSLLAPLGTERRSDFGRFAPNPAVRAALKQFFNTYKGKLIWHHAAYDVKVIIYTLYMQDLLDTRGLLEGLEVMTRVGGIDDTRLIAYLATNSTAGNVLGLKSLAHEFAGNWAKDDIKDIRRIPLPELLQYNGVDTLSTHYVRGKYWPVLVADNQEAIYHNLFLPSLKTILQMELTGMPMNKQRVQEVKEQLERIRDKFLATIRKTPVLSTFEDAMTEKEWRKDYEERRGKAKNPDKIQPKDRATFPRFEFNPNSGPQLQFLLYELMGLPVLDFTDTKLPATGAETLEKLLHHTDDDAYKGLITALIGHGQVTTILSNFIPAFEKGIEKAKDGIIWLHGSFNLGGTVSGRLSSSDPNMQNIPSNVTMMIDGVELHLGKLIKTIFMAPKGMVFGGADFNSLEDYISALTTKDPNKLGVYIQGFDGHCLRAAYYFREELIAEGLNIDVTDPKSVNRIKKEAKHWRQDSKAPTFLLTYGGTYHGMMANLGWPKEKSQRIEANYHELYKVSDQYVADRIKQATKDGYVEVAFGLRLRTPLLKQVIYGASRMPYEAAAEGRTAGNALGQSYGLLNNRAANAFMEKVWASKYRYDIWPCAQIHDAQYYLWTDDAEVTEWVNRELIACMEWQELPEIQHPTVKLGAALDIFWPAWHNPITLPNNAGKEEIITICKEAVNDYLNPKEKEAA
jgi:DNA polymerase-1